MIAIPYSEVVMTDIMAITNTGVLSGRVLVPTSTPGEFASRGVVASGVTFTPIPDSAPHPYGESRSASADLDPQRWCGRHAPVKLRGTTMCADPQ